MKEYLQVVKQVMGKFCTTRVTQVARGQNRQADSLATLASAMTEGVPLLIKVELITKLSISTTTDGGFTRVCVTVILATKLCWMDPIINFLVEDRVLDDAKEPNRVRQLASRYWLSVDRKI